MVKLACELEAFDPTSQTDTQPAKRSYSAGLQGFACSPKRTFCTHFLKSPRSLPSSREPDSCFFEERREMRGTCVILSAPQLTQVLTVPPFPYGEESPLPPEAGFFYLVLESTGPLPRPPPSPPPPGSLPDPLPHAPFRPPLTAARDGEVHSRGLRA